MGTTNDKQKPFTTPTPPKEGNLHPPAPFKGETFGYNSPLIPLLFPSFGGGRGWLAGVVKGRGMFSLLVIFFCLNPSLGSRNDVIVSLT